MAKIKLKLTEDHIRLIKNFKFIKVNDYKIDLDVYSPYGGDNLMEDLAIILGKWENFTPGTENDYDGKKFGFEVETEMLETHMYLVDNIDFIMSLLLQFIEVGLKPGFYSTISYKIDWKYSKNK